MNNVENQVNNSKDLIRQLKTTLNPQMSRCLIDSFLIRKQTDEVQHVLYNSMLFGAMVGVVVVYSISTASTLIQDSGVTDSRYHESNLIQVVNNLFAAGTDTTATTLRWALLFMAKYPQIQGKKDQAFFY